MKLGGSAIFTVMEKVVDIATWNRRESYEFFKEFQDPFVGLSVDIEVTDFYRYCKSKGLGIHHPLLYATLAAANDFEPIALRRKGEGVVLYDTIDMGCSVLKSDQSFTFAYYNWIQGESFEDFLVRTTEITRAAAKGIPLDPRPGRTNLIYGTTLPWVSFTSFSHPKQGGGHSIPRTVFGKIFERDRKWYLPFHLEVDHALMDGLDMSMYLSKVENQLRALAEL